MEGLGGVAGGLLPVDTALLGTVADVAAVLVVFGDGNRLGVGDLYRELTSRVRGW